MTCSFMWLAMLQFETKLQKCMRSGITIFKILIGGGGGGGGVYRWIYTAQLKFSTDFYMMPRFE